MELSSELCLCTFSIYCVMIELLFYSIPGSVLFSVRGGRKSK